MKDTEILSEEPVLGARLPNFENKHKNSMSNGGLCETHTEELNGFENSSNSNYEDQDHVAEQIITPNHIIDNYDGTSNVTKRLSGWFSSLWSPANGDVAEKDPIIEECGAESGVEPVDLSTKDDSIWLLGVRYKIKKDHTSNESDEPSNYYTTPGSFPHLSMQQQTLTQSDYPEEFYQDFISRIWCTYRSKYAAIKPTNFTSDAGWGCMLRSGQSLLANSLILQFLGRDWRRVHKGDDTWDKYVKILTWFIDDMSSQCPFSVHRMALLGKQLGKNIGEWFGPSTASQTIKYVITDVLSDPLAALVEDFPSAQLSVYVTTDTVVYKNDIYKGEKGNFKSVLILVAIRLGIDNINPIYYDALKACFKFPQSVGIAGGKPSSSYYFIGTQADDLFYLDPHHSRPAIELKDADELSEEELSTYHCDTLRKIHISQLDPSMLLGFYCKTSDDFDDLCVRVEEVNKKYKPVFTIAQEAPIYKDEDYDMDVFSEDDEFEKFENDSAVQEDDVDDID
ncbi:8297_t:CDS:2 [Acaulospora morrowiae]|uniref:Cysteine protease n=1 Tax=Acaulospora morrowiae TaxID=94023 RepID=A0A9N8ZWA0_9GLOM|nr:8297_t:CDS:2 [Acaulospora morrowiae]